ncbi:MAG: TRAP transporter substrate-binding protein [Succinivibrio sp.]|nr:TRAP transporter substrate-binding protein [Succinivibrio sp.]
MKFILTLLTAAVLGISSFAASAEDEFPKLHLRLGHTYAADDIQNQAALQFAREVGEKTDGSVIVDVYPNFEIGDQNSLLEQTALGTVDFSLVSEGTAAEIVPRLQALTVPFLFSDYAHAHRVIDNFIHKWENEGYEQAGLRSLAIFDVGFRHIATKGPPIYTPDDLVGLEICIPKYLGLKRSYLRYGANSKNISFFNLYKSISSGSVTASDIPLDVLLSYTIYTVQHNLCLSYHYFDSQSLLMNADLYYSLDDKLRKIIDNAAYNAQELTRELVADKEILMLEELKKKGVWINTVNRSSFEKVINDVYLEVANKAGMDQMRLLLDQVRRFE